jgi:hypothetical protein
MASRAENRVVNLAGLVQGITLVTFPAASSIFTDPTEYDFSNRQYGAIFLPQVVTALRALSGTTRRPRRLWPETAPSARGGRLRRRG